MLVWDATPAIRGAAVQIVYHTGKVRGLLMAWLRRGKHRGILTGIQQVLAEPGNDAHLADKRMANFRDDKLTRDFFDRHLKNMGPAIQDVVVAEIEIREAPAVVRKQTEKARRELKREMEKDERERQRAEKRLDRDCPGWREAQARAEPEDAPTR
jgi:hypothetical protein